MVCRMRLWDVSCVCIVGLWDTSGVFSGTMGCIGCI